MCLPPPIFLQTGQVSVAPSPALRPFRVNVTSGMPPSLRLVRVIVAHTCSKAFLKVNVTCGVPHSLRMVRVSVDPCLF